MKVKKFFKNNLEYFISGLIILLIFTIFYALFDVFPFGSNTIAHYDMAAQIIPISELVFDFLNGKSPLFYSTSFLTGANTFGYLIYFILSPFSLLMLAGGEGNLFFSLNIVFVLKLITICCVSIWFLKKYFPNLSPLKILILSLSYTFCGYMLLMYTFLSFLDYLIYAPLLVHFFYKMKETNNFLPLSFIIFFMILTCFSLGSFTLLYLFIIFGAYFFIVTEKIERANLITNTILALVVGISFALPILLPSFITYLSSGRSEVSSIFSPTHPYSLPTKIMTAIGEVILCTFAIVYIFKCDKKDKINRFLIFVETLTLVTILFEKILIVLNGGSIFGYYSRFGFVGAFTTLIISAKYLNSLQLDNKINKLFLCINYLISIIFCTLLFVCVYHAAVPLSKVIAYQSTTWAHLIIWFVFMVILILPLVFSLILKRYIGKNLLVTTFLLTLALITSNTIFFFSGGVLETTPYTTLQNLCSEIQDDARVKFYTSEYYALNQTMYNVASTSGFSSLADKESLNTLDLLGYGTSSNYSVSFGGTILSDMIVNNKYVVYPSQIDRDYLNFLGSENGLYLYENTLCLDSAFVFHDEITETSDRVLIQQQIFESLGGEGTLLNKADVRLSFENCEIQGDKIVVIDKKKPATIQYGCRLNNGELLYLYYRPSDNVSELIIDTCSVMYEGFVELLPKYSFIPNIAFNTIVITEDIFLKSLEFYTLDYSLLENLNTISSPVTKDYNKITSTISLNENSTIMLPYTTLDGYTLYVNGQKQTFTNDFLSFMTFELSAGTNEIEIVFNNPLHKYILIGFIIGAIFIVIAFVVYHYKEKISKKFIIIAFSIILGAFLTFFIAFPTTVQLLQFVGIF